jgi:hypothetical protein
MVPESSPESAYLGTDIEYPVTDSDIPEEECPRKTTLAIGDGITITIGKEFAPNDFVLDTDFVETNLDEALEADLDPLTVQICYGLGSHEYLDLLLRDIWPTAQPPFMLMDEGVFLGELDRQLAEPYSASMSLCHEGLPLDVETDVPPDVSLLPQSQSASIGFLHVPPAGSLHEQDSLDIVGFTDPAGLGFNTNIVGGSW